MFIDRSGRPALLLRRIGRGRSLLWCGGLDGDSLPTGSAARKLLSSLTTLLVAATRTEPATRRSLTLCHGDGGRPWLRVERHPGEQPTLPITLWRAGQPMAAPEQIVALHRRAYGLPLPAAPPWLTRVQWHDGTVLALAPGPSVQRESWLHLHTTCERTLNISAAILRNVRLRTVPS